jgi:hypothetical protein
MPKKAATARRRAQHNKPKVQKSFELVRPEKVVTEEEGESNTIEAQESTATEIEESSTTPTKVSTANTKPVKPKTPAKVAVATQEETKTQERKNTSAPGSASARLAARRQAAQRLQQRSTATLITSEHFAYVRKDLIRIAVFAAFMFTAIIVLYFTLGRA